MITLILLSAISLCFAIKAFVYANKYKQHQKDFHNANTEYLKMFGGNEKVKQTYRLLQLSLLDLFTSVLMSGFFLWLVIMLISTGLWRM